MVESHVLRITRQLGPGEFERLLSQVSEEKRSRIRRFLFFADAQRALLGDLLARYAIRKRAGVRRDRIRIGLNPYGKPVLIRPRGLCFNISHAEDWVVCAVDRRPVGIDVEKIRPVKPGLAERFFSPEEYLDLMGMEEVQLPERFFRIWTLKESYIKMIGRGLRMPLPSFTIRISGDSIMLQNSAEGDIHPHFRQDRLGDHIISICARTESFGAPNLLQMEDLIQCCAEESATPLDLAMPEKAAGDQPKPLY